MFVKYIIFLFLFLCSNFLFSKEKNFNFFGFNDFIKTIDYIKKYYVIDVDDINLFDGIVKGLLKSLDMHSNFFEKNEFEELKLLTFGEFVGLGVEISLIKGFPVIVGILPESPAIKNGLQVGDVLIGIDNKSLNGLSLKQIVSLIRGGKNTNIYISFIRFNCNRLCSVVLKREIIKLSSIKYDLIDSHYGYIRIFQFQLKTYDEFLSAINNIKVLSNNSIYGFIIDLRNNPGGLLDVSAKISNLFLNSELLYLNNLIVYTRGKNSFIQLKKKANGKDILNGLPIIILVNSGTASAAEILAGSLQDHRRAIVVGNTTFGKGSVQTIFPLKECGGALKLTTSYFYTPFGRSIQLQGIEPDIITTKLFIDIDSDNYLYNLKFMNIYKNLFIIDNCLYEGLCLLKSFQLFSFFN